MGDMYVYKDYISYHLAIDKTVLHCLYGPIGVFISPTTFFTHLKTY